MGLDLAFGGGVGESSTAPPEPEIEILNDPRPSFSARIDLGRRFGDAPCPSKQSRKTIREALRPDAKRILIHQYDDRSWRDLTPVRGYLSRLLSAEPEGGMLSSAVYWAEARPAEIFASVEFANGQRPTAPARQRLCSSSGRVGM